MSSNTATLYSSKYGTRVQQLHPTACRSNDLKCQISYHKHFLHTRQCMRLGTVSEQVKLLHPHTTILATDIAPGMINEI
jgi:hypothetical protein